MIFLIIFFDHLGIGPPVVPGASAECRKSVYGYNAYKAAFQCIIKTQHTAVYFNRPCLCYHFTNRSSFGSGFKKSVEANINSVSDQILNKDDMPDEFSFSTSSPMINTAIVVNAITMI